MTWSEELLCRLRGVLSAKAEQLTSSSSGKIRILQRYLVLLAHYSLQIAVAISHQVIVLLFLPCFFFFAKHEDFYFIFSSSTKTAGLMQPCPQSFSIALVFSRDILHLTDIVSLDITNVFKIWSMVSWIWRISQEICAHQNWRNILNKELKRCNTIPC